MKKVIGTISKPEGDRNRLFQVIECEDCGHTTHERRSTRVQKALQSGCNSCRTIYAQEKEERRRESIKSPDGRSFHPLYKCWTDMKYRTSNPNCPQYKDYGGRGITVCDEWKDDFWMFVYHVGPKPGPEYSLDRVDNDYIYCPENCKWSTQKEQMNNTRRSVS